MIMLRIQNQICQIFGVGKENDHLKLFPLFFIELSDLYL